MKSYLKLVLVTGALALGVAPGTALAAGPPSGIPGQGSEHMPSNQETENASSTGSREAEQVPSNPAGGHASAGREHVPSDPGSQAGHPEGTPPSNQGTEHSFGETPGPAAGLPAKARAYGLYCRTEGTEHVAGTPGTPFARCVTAMAKLTDGAADNPRTACQNEGRRHVAGQRGTPFALCVSGGARLLREAAEAAEEESSSGEEEPSGEEGSPEE